MTDLSNQSFMTGAMQGYSLAEASAMRRDEADMRKKQFDQQTKLTDMKIAGEERKQLESEFQRDVRSMYSSGQVPDGFAEKYKSLGVGKLMDPARRDELQDMGAIFMRAKESGDWNNRDMLDAGNVLLKDQLAGREAKDGLKRRIAGVRQLKDGRVAFELEVTRPDGSSYRAPMTKNGRSDKGDMVIAIDEAKLEEMTNAALNQANTAYLIDKAGGDPKALADMLYFTVFGSKLTPQPKNTGYEYKTGYDKNGRETLYQFNKADGSHRVIGGSKAPDGKSAKDLKAMQVDLKYIMDGRADILSDSNYLDDTERDAALNRFDENVRTMYGLSSGQLMQLSAKKRQLGNMEPLTIQEAHAYAAGLERKARSGTPGAGEATPVAGTADTVSNVAPEPKREPPRPRSAEEQKIAELEAMAGDPAYPWNAQAKFQKQADELKAKMAKRNQSRQPPKPMNKQERFEREMESLQQRLDVATSTEEINAVVMEMANLSANNNSQDSTSLASF